MSFGIAVALSSPGHSYWTYSLALKLRGTSEFLRITTRMYIQLKKNENLGERAQRPCLSFSVVSLSITTFSCIE